MDTLLVVNAGSSSVKFQVFGAEAGVDDEDRVRHRPYSTRNFCRSAVA